MYQVEITYMNRKKKVYITSDGQEPFITYGNDKNVRTISVELIKD